MRPLYGYWGVFFLRGVGNEVVLCVSMLMLVARGLSLSEIAFILMLGFAATTILEIPSGMAGDLWGRKRLWVLSVLCSLVWLFACLTGWKPLIALGALVNGVGVALGSGTMDALYVERWMERFGKEHLARAGMWSTLCTYAGFAAGALLSGSLPVAWMQTVPYTLHLTVSLLLFAVMLAAGIGVVHETAASSKTTSWKASLQEMHTQLKQTGRLTADQPILLLVLSAAVIMGFSTVGVELYWQPRLEVLSPPEQLSWMLSICSFFSMAMLAVSGIGAAAVLERVKTTTGKVAVYAAYRFTMIGMTACMAFIGQAPLFIFYLFVCAVLYGYGRTGYGRCGAFARGGAQFTARHGDECTKPCAPIRRNDFPSAVRSAFAENRADAGMAAFSGDSWHWFYAVPLDFWETQEGESG